MDNKSDVIGEIIKIEDVSWNLLYIFSVLHYTKILKEKYMGQHTWFLKSKELYLKQNELYEKLDSFEECEIYLDDMELYQLNHQIDEIDKENRAEYHDLFRTSKRNSDGTYTDDVIFSKAECFEWINNPDNGVSFKNTVFDSHEVEMENKEWAIVELNKFWSEYPDGVIYFG